MAGSHQKQNSSGMRFSCAQHRLGAWNTRTSAGRNPLLRRIWNWVSYKRVMVDSLGRMAGPDDIVLDMGCGTTAYGHWLIGRTPCTVVAVDWSVEALTQAPPPARGAILRVQADMRNLPFKHEVFDGAYTIDALGHVEQPGQALDEMLRTMKPGAAAFVHSECADHLKRWPDSALVERLGEDLLAKGDGHVALRPSAETHTDLARRFNVRGFFSPPGYAGWLLGYPEKYAPAFKKAGWTFLWVIASFMAWIRKMPVLGWMLRLLNAATNHLELYFSLHGGGSCFAMVEKPGSADKINRPQPFFF